MCHTVTKVRILYLNDPKHQHIIADRSCALTIRTTWLWIQLLSYGRPISSRLWVTLDRQAIAIELLFQTEPKGRFG